jgi:hypothetical protein
MYMSATANKTTRGTNHPRGEDVRTIDVEKLILDPENPRLRLPANPTQETIARQLWEEHRLEELMASLLANGYFDEEPLVATPHSRSGYFVVVEGNRRLAALKILTDPTLAAALRIRDLPPSSGSQLSQLRQVPVKVYQKREHVLPYLGYRHITGIKEWDADAKAKYIYQLHHQSGKDLREIATIIGDRYGYTERLFLGWSLVKQAEKENGFSERDTQKFFFSYMYDAVRMPEVRQFLGLGENEYRVDRKHVANLKELTTWLFGSKSARKPPIVEKKDELKKLGYVVASEDGLDALRRNASLEAAYQETVGEEDELLNSLTEASRKLDRAKAVLHRHKRKPKVRQEVEKCLGTAQALKKELDL